MATDTITPALCVEETAEAFLASVAGFDAEVVPGPDCAHLAALCARVEKAASGVRLLAAARAVACGAHKQAGLADPVAYLARQAGTTGAGARAALELARSLDDHPATKAALLEGAISLAQGREIARSEHEVPGAEDELVALAKGSDLSRLRDETRSRRLASLHPTELHSRQKAARHLRHWRDGLGMVRLDGALPPEEGIPLVTRIEREAKRLHQEAKRRGSEEAFPAHAADALVALCTGTAKSGKGRVDLVVVCDIYAWRRGHAHEGEPCHLIGGGPLPVEVAKQLADDAFIKVVLHDGKDIQRVCHLGRRYTAELLTAMDLGPVPSFSGRACVDCQRTFGLEHDHTDPVAHTGKTAYTNMRDRCYPCHADKTERDRQAGLLGKRAKARGPGPPVKKKPATQKQVPESEPPPVPGGSPPAPARTTTARRAPPHETGDP